MSLFGAQKPDAAPTFGTSTSMPAFGAKPATVPIFGAASTALTGTSTGAPTLFGTTAPSGQAATPGFGGFGTATTATANAPKPSLFGAATATTTQASLFGAAATTTNQPSLFGAAGTGATQTGGLFGAKPAVTTPATGFLGLTSKLGTTTGAQQQQSLQAQVQTLQDVIQNSENLMRSLTAPEIFGDGRDSIIAKLNQILAACGVAGGYFKTDQQRFAYTNENPFYRFKALGYSRRSDYNDSDGVVSLVLSVNYEQLATAAQRQKFIDALNVILGNNINVRAHIELVRPLPDSQTEVLFYVSQRGRGRPSSTELCAYLKQPAQEAQLKTQLAVVSVVSRISMDDSRLQTFVKNPPRGFDPQIWAQAIAENPDPKRLLPYPIRGFDQLRKRQDLQIAENRLEERVVVELKRRLTSVFSELSNGQNRCVFHRQKQKELSHRLLRCLAVQALIQQYTVSIDSDEEKLESRLEALSACISAPNQIKARIKIILKTLRENAEEMKSRDKGSLSSLKETDITHIRRYLSRAQQALELLVSTVKSNSSDFKIIETHSC